jgi:SAM-dependent methyltransferase
MGSSTAADLTCICCDRRAFRHFRTVRGHRLYRCQACGFVTVHPLPDLEDLQVHYNETRTGEEKRRRSGQSLAAFMTASNNPKRDFFENVLSRVTAMVRRPSMDILEIGSGLGHFIHFANETGHRAIGTEVTAEYAELSSERLNGRIVYVEGDRYAEHFPPAAFDLIYMEHVFEHMREPEPILAQIRQLLRPGGVLVLAVPNMDSLSSRLQGRHWAWGAPPDHLRFYNPVNLSLLLVKHGFSVAASFARDYHHRSIPQLYSLRRSLNLWRRLVGRRPKPYRYAYPRTPAEHLLLAPYYLLYPLIRRSWRRSAGSELVVLARRPEAP